MDKVGVVWGVPRRKTDSGIICSRGDQDDPPPSQPQLSQHNETSPKDTNAG